MYQMSCNNTLNAGQGGCGRGNNAYLRGFHATRVVIQMLASWDTVEQQTSWSWLRRLQQEVPEPARTCRGTIGSRKKINLQEKARAKAIKEQIGIELWLKSLRLLKPKSSKSLPIAGFSMKLK